VARESCSGVIVGSQVASSVGAEVLVGVQTVYVAVAESGDTGVWGSGATGAEAVAAARSRVEATAEWAGDDPWEGTTAEEWVAALVVVALTGPAAAVRVVVAELLD